jgi:hypothetical protein
LGITVQNNLKWDTHVKSQLKKCSKRMYHVRCLKNLYVDNTIICLVYNSLVASVLTYALCSWYGSTNSSEKKCLVSIRKRVCRIVGPDFCNLLNDSSTMYKERCIKFAKKVLSSASHPLNKYYAMLPHGRRFRSLRCRTERYRSTCVPSSIRFLNN